MAYYLKQTKSKNRIYLQICESYYHKEKKQTAQKTYKNLGALQNFLDEGIKDPISHFKKEVEQLNKSRKEAKAKKISNKSPLKNIGYFLFKSMLTKLNIKEFVDYFKLTHDFQYDLFDVLSLLIYSRCIDPQSKRKTMNDVIPQLFEKCNFSYDQMLDALEFLGDDYKKIVEIFRMQTQNIYGISTAKTYFDCTNFYFEIDKEDELRKKGPSKENRKSPIIGMGLLLDENQIPIAIDIFPGNQSEKPVLPKLINNLKATNKINGRTVVVADKGLNCSQNIYEAKINDNGYIFSKSVKQLSDVEKSWVLNENGYEDVLDNKGKLSYRFKSCIDEYPYTFNCNGQNIKMNLTEKRVVSFNPKLAKKKREEINKMVNKVKALVHSQVKRNELGDKAKYVNFVDDKGEKAITSINYDAIEKDLKLAGYNLMVTSEINMTKEDIYSTYHNLWRIEESFKIMKSQLDARPVFLRKESTIKGHFLICYLAVLLERLFQFKVFKNYFSASEIMNFVRELKVVKIDKNSYINVSKRSKLSYNIAKNFKLPIDNYMLSNIDILKILKFKLEP